MFQREHSNGQSSRAGQVSLYSCCCCKRTVCVAAGRGSRCYRVSSWSCQHPLAVVGQDSRWIGTVGMATQQRRLFVEDGGRLWQSLEESGQRRVIADDRRHGMTSVMMCSGGWCWVWVPWLAWFGGALSPKVARAGSFHYQPAARLMYV